MKVRDVAKGHRLLGVVQDDGARGGHGEDDSVGQQEHGFRLGGRVQVPQLEQHRAAAHTHGVLVQRWQVHHRPDIKPRPKCQLPQL